MKTIIINATAARSSGSLTILKDFIAYCSSDDCSSDMKFILFTTVDCFNMTNKLRIVKLPVMSWYQRIKWDAGGLKTFCNKENIKPDIIISMQNTCTNYQDIPQLVYYHQSLPLVKYNWNPFIKEERILFLYAHFYKFFVNKYNDDAQYVVQLPYIKELFLKKFHNILDSNVHVIRPNDPEICLESYVKEEHPYRFIYPATPLSYKNHKCIIEAFSMLLDRKDIDSSVQLILTIPDNCKIAKLVKEYNLENNIKCLGSMAYEDLLNLYKNSNVLLFPSEIETYGMPLVEASKFGLHIIAADLPYAREVLEEYDDKIFINPNDYDAWADEMKTLIYKSLEEKKSIKRKNSWIDFIDIVNEMTNDK